MALNRKALTSLESGSDFQVSRNWPLSILPSSRKTACSGSLSAKYHTGCWLFLIATWSVLLRGVPGGGRFWREIMGSSVCEEEPGAMGGSCKEGGARKESFLLGGGFAENNGNLLCKGPGW
jgi:hypothetical protein